ncbi:MAG TPA: TadE/TadG family type IV pilus assembly protein [Caulobacteraceae bacterium]
MGARTTSRLRQLGDRAGAAAVELALVFPFLVMVVFGIWYIGWALYSGGEVRHAVELGSRVYISNPNATLDDLRTAVSSHLLDVPITNLTLSAATQAVGSATTEHITWSYQTVVSIPFVPTLPMNFTGSIDVPMAS